MNHDAEITEVSDPRDMTIDDPPPPVPRDPDPQGQADRRRDRRPGNRFGRRRRWHPRPGPAGAQPLGSSRRQAAVLDLQLAAGHAAGAVAHAPMTRVVLGSASTGRLSVLRQAGVEPLVIVSGVDEDAVMAAHPGATPAELVCALARRRQLASRRCCRTAMSAADCVVIGCDSMLLLDGRLCGKPGTPERARAQWESMAGRSGELLTGHSVLRLRRWRDLWPEDETASTTVHFGHPSPPTWWPTSPAANRSGSPAASPSTDWAAGSSIASRATRPT